jgi:tyrosine-specific transport protein
MAKTYLRGIGLLVGMIFGAGIFALPYVFLKAGVFWGLFHFALTFIILLFLHLLYGEVSYYTEGKHRFTGYVEMFLGKWAKELAFLTTIVSYYGSLLVYGLLAGLFLANIFTGLSSQSLAMLFFVFCGLLLFYRKGNTASINFYLTIPLFGFIIYLLFLALPHIKLANFSFFNFTSDWFLPYGVWLFALSGFSVIPEIRDIFAKAPFAGFKKTITFGFMLAAVFFLVFIIAVYGTGGSATTEEALLGLGAVLGKNALLVGSLIGFLSVFGAFLALSLDMKNIFKIDYKIPNFLALALTVIPPLILFLMGASDFVKILGITGTLGMGVLGVFIILMSRKMRKINTGDFIPTSRIFENFILFAVIAGVLFELWRIVF